MASPCSCWRDGVQVEKYRPKRLTEVVGNAAAVEAFRRFVQERAFPNLILAVGSLLTLLLSVTDWLTGTPRCWQDDMP